MFDWPFFLNEKKRKQISLVHFSTFLDASSGFPAKWRPRNDFRNSMLLTCYYPDLGCASDWLAAREICLNQSEHYPHRGSDTSSVWNFCSRFSDVISRWNQFWRREMSACFSGLFIAIKQQRASWVANALIRKESYTLIFSFVFLFQDKIIRIHS